MTQPLTPRTYRIDAIRRCGLWTGAALLGALPVVLADTEASDYQWRPALFAGLLVLPVALLLIWLSQRIRFEMTTDGCALFSPGLSTQVSWAEVHYICAGSSLTGVVLKRPQNSRSMRRQKWFADRSGHDSFSYTAKQLELVNQLRFIDLRAFSRQLRGDDFARVVAAYRVQYRRAQIDN